MTTQEIKKTSKEVMQKLERLCSHVNTITNGNSVLYLNRSVHYEACEYYEVIAISECIGGENVLCEHLFLSSHTSEDEATAFYKEITNKIK